jgi:hypothetical protein
MLLFTALSSSDDPLSVPFPPFFFGSIVTVRLGSFDAPLVLSNKLLDRLKSFGPLALLAIYCCTSI